MKISNFLKAFCLSIVAVLLMNSSVNAQPNSLTKEEMLYYTSTWKGDRFPDGRPKVSDDVIRRMRYVSVTEAWQILNSMSDMTEGQGQISFGEFRRPTYSNQYYGEFKQMREGVVICGRASTIQFMPYRPDLNGLIQEKGTKDGRGRGQYTWGIDQLQDGDVYVANVCEGILDASHVGDNLGTTIWTKTGNGAVIRGTLRDLDGNMEVDENFNFLVRDFRPQANSSNLVIGINGPIQIGYITVMPGDIVLTTREGVVFIPPQLALRVVEESERTRMQDVFAHEGVRQGRYTAQQADGGFTRQMHEDFTKWLNDNAETMGKFFSDPKAAPSPEFIRAWVKERQANPPRAR
ncbi:MAG: RraA family protein [Bacteroidales bacterium]|nr:RraA family protein [Bacteroidales bacterium]